MRLIISIALLLFLFTSILINVSCTKEPEQVDMEYSKMEPEEADIEEVESEISDAELHYNAGLDFREKDLFEKAIEEFDAAIELEPQFAEAYYKRGNIYCKMGQLETGIQDLNKAIELNSQLNDAYYDRGAAYCTLGKLEQGIEDFNEAIRLNPLDAMAYGSRGNAYCELGEFKKAMLDCDAAVKLDPQYGYAYYVRGNIYRQQKLFEKAIENYDEAISIDPQLVFAYCDRAGVYHELNQFEKAIQDYDEAIRLDPTESSAYYNRGNAYCRLAQYENGILDFNEAIALDPLFTQAYFNRGLALGNVGRTDEAIADFEIFIDLTDDESQSIKARLEIEKLTRVQLDITSMVSPDFIDLARFTLSNEDLLEGVWLKSFQELDNNQLNDTITLLDELEDVSLDFKGAYISYLSCLLENGYKRSLSTTSNSEIFQQEILEFSSLEKAEAAMVMLPQLTLDLLSKTWEELGFEVTTELIEINNHDLSPDSWGVFVSMQVNNDIMSLYFISAREGSIISSITLTDSTITFSPYSVDTIDDALMLSRKALSKVKEEITTLYEYNM